VLVLVRIDDTPIQKHECEKKALLQNFESQNPERSKSQMTQNPDNLKSRMGENNTFWKWEFSLKDIVRWLFEIWEKENYSSRYSTVDFLMYFDVKNYHY
jgi:hypothetical protein